MKPLTTATERHMKQRLLLTSLLFITASSFMVGCEKPQVVDASTTATQGEIQYTVLPYELRMLELDTPSGTVKYAKPVMIIPVKMKNVGKSEFVYNPEHNSTQMTETTTPLLYIEPKGEDVKLPPEQKTIVNGAYLENGKLPEQLESRTTIAPGAEITDYYLFEEPSKTDVDLILSIPPVTNRGKLPLLFKLKYSPETPKGPKVYSEGEPVKVGDAEFTVTGHAVEYIPTSDSTLGKGYTAQPLLKIAFTVKNDGSEPITYAPDHRSVGFQGPGLFSVSKTLERVRLQPTVQADGQITQSQTIEPGASITDYLLFMPPARKEDLKLEVPGTLFGQQGAARIMLEVDPKPPEKPKDMTTPKVIKKDADEDK